MIRIEGYIPKQLLDLPVDDLDELVFIGRPIVVRVVEQDFSPDGAGPRSRAPSRAVLSLTRACRR
jgi:hypothetical protein